MEVSELLKMISSIPERKSKCRGNLRLKVLLKSTYDYARRSWIDGQFGKPQKLQTLLKNSISSPSSTLSSDDSALPSATEAVACFEGQSAVELNNQVELHSSVSDDVLRSDLSLEDDEEDDEIKPKISERTKENMPELQRVMKKLLRNCKMLVEIDDLSRSSFPDYRLNLRKLNRIILLSRIARIHLERDYENQDFGQQKTNRKALKLIRYLLKQCKTLLNVNYSSQLDQHKLKKIIRKLKKFESCAEKIVSFERGREKRHLNGHVDKMDTLGHKKVSNETHSFPREKDPEGKCHLELGSSPKINFIQSSNVNSTDIQKNGPETQNSAGEELRNCNPQEKMSHYKKLFLHHYKYHRPNIVAYKNFPEGKAAFCSKNNLVQSPVVTSTNSNRISLKRPIGEVYQEEQQKMDRKQLCVRSHGLHS